MFEYESQNKNTSGKESWSKTSPMRYSRVLRSSSSRVRADNEHVWTVTTMIRPPLRKLHHYELHTTRSQQCSLKHCGRGAGTIESRGCNTFHGGINARGTLWIHADRDRETRFSLYPPPYWQSVKSTVLHRTQLSNHRTLRSLSSPQSCAAITPVQLQEVKKLTPRFN